MNTEQQARAAFDAQYGNLMGVRGELYYMALGVFKAGFEAGRASADQPATEQPKADEDGWIAWAGGECPVLVDVKSRSGFTVNCVRPEAIYWGRGQQLGVGDIIAYRISRGTA